MVLSLFLASTAGVIALEAFFKVAVGRTGAAADGAVETVVEARARDGLADGGVLVAFFLASDDATTPAAFFAADDGVAVADAAVAFTGFVAAVGGVIVAVGLFVVVAVVVVFGLEADDALGASEGGDGGFTVFAGAATAFFVAGNPPVARPLMDYFL